MGLVLGLIKAVIWAMVLLIAATIGCCFGAVCGIFFGPIKIIEWTRNGDEGVSTDKI